MILSSQIPPDGPQQAAASCQCNSLYLELKRDIGTMKTNQPLDKLKEENSALRAELLSLQKQCDIVRNQQHLRHLRIKRRRSKQRRQTIAIRPTLRSIRTRNYLSQRRPSSSATQVKECTWMEAREGSWTSGCSQIVCGGHNK